ncbi:MAG: ferritin-like domain-containing protein [Alphaproteobacteria bacterium]
MTEENFMGVDIKVGKLTPLPGDVPSSAEALEKYEREFHSHSQVWGEILQTNFERLSKGNYSLHWMNGDANNWGGQKPKISSRGLTYIDINRVKGSGEIGEVTAWKSFAPRGSIREPYKNMMPVLESYDVTHKNDVWSDNVAPLYEEAKARQWNATRDIPWDEIGDLPEDIAKASCQLSTFLSEIEFAAADFPARWLYRIPQDYLEVKSFLATQIMDEARHQEVFRKRALMGGGLLHASPGFEWALKSILEAPNHVMGTFLLNLLGEGLVLSLFRSGEMIAKTSTDKEIFRLCMQDEARHVSYGVLQFKYYLDHHANRPQAEEELHRFSDLGEQIIMTAFSEATLNEPIAILLGGGLKHIDKGMDGLGKLWAVFIEEYLQRCDRAGFDRRARCTIPKEFPWGSARAA